VDHCSSWVSLQTNVIATIKRDGRERSRNAGALISYKIADYTRE